MKKENKIVRIENVIKQSTSNVRLNKINDIIKQHIQKVDFKFKSVNIE